jgi:iron complex outermembrane receptor protein
VNLSSYFDWVAGRTAFGAELRNEDLVSGNLGEPLSQPHHIKGTDRDYTLGINRTNISGYLEHNLLLRNFTLSAGFIAVKNTWSNMNMTVYPGIDISYRPGSDWKLHASYNTSLRMPSFTEMYYKVQGYSADPHLKPEEMQAVEVGINWRHKGLDASITGWHHHGKNMIDWIMDTSKGDQAIWESVNHTTINSVGLEVSAGLDFRQLLPSQSMLKSLKLSYSYIDQDKKQEANIVSQYALEYLRHKFIGNLNLQLAKTIELSISARWQDRVGSYTGFDNTVSDYKPYFLTDARLAWKGTHWKIYAEANNLFDVSYHDYGLVEQPGRWLIAGVNLNI